jgi:hypothetical protein
MLESQDKLYGRFFNPDERKTFNEVEVAEAVALLTSKANKRIIEKGRQCFSSDYESIGVLQLEVEEFKEAVQARLSYDAKIEELLDIAWAALIGVMTLRKEMENGI